MEKNSTWLAVVALALFDASDRVLLQQRPAGKSHAGLWEFPGGKVEKGEKPREALCREIAEELAIRVSENALMPALLADEGGYGRLVLMLYTARRWEGQIAAQDGQSWGWFDLSQAGDLPMPPMDRHLLEGLLALAIAKLP